MSDGVIDPGRRLRLRPVGDPASGGSLSLRRLREIEAVLGSAIDPSPADRGAGRHLDGGRALERDSIELLRAFNRIADPQARRDVLRLVLAAAREAGS